VQRRRAGDKRGDYLAAPFVDIRDCGCVHSNTLTNRRIEISRAATDVPARRPNALWTR
jgi:hypothetical protein